MILRDNNNPTFQLWAAAMFAGAAFFIALPGTMFAANEKDYHQRVEPLLKSYCFDCHGDGVEKGEVAFDTYTNFSAHAADRKLWLAVWQNLQTQMMPPAKKPQPSENERQQVIKWIERD